MISRNALVLAVIAIGIAVYASITHSSLLIVIGMYLIFSILALGSYLSDRLECIEKKLDAILTRSTQT